MSVKAKSSNSVKSTEGQRRFQQVLFEAFSQSRIKNPSYSLRAFARRLGLSPAALSEILAGKRDVSAKLATRTLERLNANPEDLVVVSEALHKDRGRGVKHLQPPVVSILSIDQFKTVTDWYHFGILALLETEDCKHDVSFLAQRLRISPREVVGALERLSRLGMVKKGADGTLKLTGEEFYTTDGIPSSAIRAAHSQALEFAKRSLEMDEVSKRDFTTATIAVNPEQLPKARKLIRKFRTDLAKLMGRDSKTEVYMLSVNFFPLSR